MPPLFRRRHERHAIDDAEMIRHYFQRLMPMPLLRRHVFASESHFRRHS